MNKTALLTTISGGVLLIFTTEYIRRRKMKGKRFGDLVFGKAVTTSEKFDDAMQELKKREKKPNNDIGMTCMERTELIDRVKAMSPEEMELVVEHIPIDICMNRISKEIERAKAFEATIMNAVDMVKE